MSLEVFGDEGFIGVCAACGEEPIDCQCLDEPCERGTHVWAGQQQGGPPDMAESYEWVGYCDICGVERGEIDSLEEKDG